MSSIPVVDLSKFKAADAATKQGFVNELGAAFEQVGFVAVQNNGIQQSLIDDYFTSVERFFKLPEATKKQYEIAELHGQRGYTSFGKEHAKDADAADLKEFWQVGQTVKGDDPLKDQYPENVPMNEFVEFNELGIELYKSFEQTGLQLMQAIALHLGLHENYFDEPMHHGNSILRAIHYPPITHEPGSAVRSEQHEDINMITLLVGASAEGLQVLSKQDQWVDVTAEKGELIVNVGDMLQRLTNNQLRSTTHRVVNPPREKWYTSRYSIPFFYHPRPEMPLNCLEQCIDEQHPKQFADITADEYLNERLIEIGLKKA